MATSWREWLADENLIKLFDFPADLLDRQWEPNVDDQRAAWLLYVELRTRIATQPLHHLDGGEAAALYSMYTLFKEVRDLIKDDSHPKAEHFSELGFQFLNRVLRPFTAEWHQKSERGLLVVHDVKIRFRSELEGLQTQIRAFCTLMGRLGRGYCLSECGDNYAYDPPHDEVYLGAPISFVVDADPVVPSAQNDGLYSMEYVLTAERRALLARRQSIQAHYSEFYAAPEEQKSVGKELRNVVGVALSGGGIRSATLCQGVFQGLGRTRVLLDADYLSTVSGGGYFGTFLSTFLNVELDESTSDNSPGVGLGPKDRPFGISEASPSLEHLRNNSRYLLTGGLWGLLKAFSMLLYGAGVQVFLALFIVLIISSLLIIPTNQWFYWPLYGFTLVWLVFLAVMSQALTWRVHPKRKKRSENWESATFVLGCVVFAGWFLVFWKKALHDSPVSVKESLAVLCAVVLIPFVLLLLASMLKKHKPWSQSIMRFGLIALPTLLLLWIFWLGVDHTVHGKISMFSTVLAKYWIWILFFTVLFFYHMLFLDVNAMTLHRFYKHRLSIAYAKSMHGHHFGEDGYTPTKLSQLGEHNPTIPYHLYNAALNGNSEGNDKHNRRGAGFFMFSKLFCGSESEKFWRTSPLEGAGGVGFDVESSNPVLDAPAAMAISGAAISPNMGTIPAEFARRLLVLANLRLNFWFRRPVGDEKYRFPTFYYLLREYFGAVTLDLPHWNLSDGGHIENLGIYTLLQRRCKFIIAIDGEADLAMTRGAITRVIRYARMDLRTELTIDTNAFATDVDGYSDAHFVVGSIKYPDNTIGYLLYLKSSVTGNEPDDVTDYRRRNPTFPHQTTADQFFDEEQFEAYRALGEHMAKEVLKPELIGIRTTEQLHQLGVEALFQELVNRHFTPDSRTR